MTTEGSPYPARRERMLLACGIAFAVAQLAMLVVFAVAILPYLGVPDAPSADRAQAFAAYGHRLRIGNYFLMLPSALFLLFLGGMRSALRRIEGGGGALASSAALAGAAMAMLWPLAGVISDLGIDLALRGGDVHSVAALDGIGPYSLALSAIPRSVLVGSATLIVLDSSAFPRWTAWFGFVVAAMSIAGSTTLIVPSLFPLLGLSTVIFEVWLIAFCVLLIRRSPRAAP